MPQVVCGNCDQRYDVAQEDLKEFLLTVTTEPPAELVEPQSIVEVPSCMVCIGGFDSVEGDIFLLEESE